jgi:hypothetical protein
MQQTVAYRKAALTATTRRLFRRRSRLQSADGRVTLFHCAEHLRHEAINDSLVLSIELPQCAAPLWVATALYPLKGVASIPRGGALPPLDFIRH